MKKTWRILACGAAFGTGMILADAQDAPAPAAVEPAAAPAAAEAAAPAVVEAPVVPAAETAAAPAVDPENPLAFLPDTVATVGDQPITRDDLIKEAKPILRMIQAQQGDQVHPKEQWLELARQVTEGIIEKSILLDLAAADGLKPSPEKGEEEYRKILAEVPEEQVKTVIAQQGMTLDELKTQIAVAGTIRDWVDSVAAKTVVPDEAIAAFYQKNTDRFKTEESVEASHILVRPKELSKEEMDKLSPEDQAAQKDKAKAEAKAKAEGLLKRVQDGEDFAAVAEAESDCPSGKRAKGSLGEFSRGQMVKPFEDAAFALDAGAMSGLVETSFGYHIIKTTRHTVAGATPLEEVKDDLKVELQKSQVGEKIKALLDGEKQKRNVKILI
jgi:peptidyl-prolyl cis-trans isomerase C